jgi:two-component system response regulator PhoP
MRALVVEDEAPLREQLAERLRVEGYVVDLAADGEEGAFIGRDYPVDLAIVDLGLPKLPGIEVIRRWRQPG